MRTHCKLHDYPASSSYMQLMSRDCVKASMKIWFEVCESFEHKIKLLSKGIELGEWVTIPTTYAGGAKGT